MIGAAHPGLRFGLVLTTIAVGLFAAVVPAALCDINFASNDGLHVALAGFVEEIGGREKVAVVGDGHGWHLLAGGFVQQLRSLASPVEQAKIRVDVQMYELRLPHKLDSKALSRDLHYANLSFPQARI